MPVWKEITKMVNDNHNIPLNVQAREIMFRPAQIIESSMSYTPSRSGWYKVIVVGKGGSTYGSYDDIGIGGSGGVSISTLKLLSTESYQITSSYGTFSFGDMTATYGEDGTYSKGGNGGTATGGQENYPGLKGNLTSGGNNSVHGQDVSVYIPGMMERNQASEGYVSYRNEESYYVTAYSGNGIMGRGASGGYAQNRSASVTTESQPGGVIIIPLEYLE